MRVSIHTVTKTLSRNDIGLTGGHQAGITVPKVSRMLEFFPQLDATEFNPSVKLTGIDTADGTEFLMTYIYYNGKTLGRSTRNEYRLTGLTAFMRRHQATEGDVLWIERVRTSIYRLSLERMLMPRTELPQKILLKGTWSTIRKAAR
ncbi:EcoRII N-terminal effector-binding domain-containing protein [Arthrobacter mobilis]|uniref:Restriction endonuclease n=1 Tax=Arthrobacter mobilis TaxID=2724944 RepID=A0A7X6HD76_9MICC|nr:EcoRII N-terminal effector-binding domain-containing protein [Arthrobacter mobilis]NKX54375.1 restriction endonuclease [Arthrobacter mobilis]